jgi:hypothetical protein
MNMNDDLSLDILTVLIAKLESVGVEFADGLSESRLIEIEESLESKIPQDLRSLLAIKLPISFNGDQKFPRWDKEIKKELVDSRDVIEKSFQFDIKNNGYWSEELFGKRPASLDDAWKKAVKEIKDWPPLIRIYGHRYMPTAPRESGNPVISFWQPSDSVIYGANLVDYFQKEFKISMQEVLVTGNDKLVSIPKWGEALNI